MKYHISPCDLKYVDISTTVPVAVCRALYCFSTCDGLANIWDKWSLPTQWEMTKGQHWTTETAFIFFITLQWSHNERDGVSNHQPRDCLLNRLFKAQIIRKYQSSASLAFVRGIHRWPVNSPHKEPVTRKMFSFDDVIMTCCDKTTYPIEE